LPSSTVPTLPANDPTLGFINPTDFGFNPLVTDDFRFNDTSNGNDYYLLNNLESLNPLGGALDATPTLDSLQEPPSTIDLEYHTVPSIHQNTFNTSSPTMASNAESNTSSTEGSPWLSDSKSPSVSDNRPVPNAPDTRIENFLNNLMFLKSPMPPTSTASGASLDTGAEGTDLVAETLKRQRGSDPDVLTACWTSPLCPSNQKKDGNPPDPANCGGACAPFLFGDQPLPDTIATSLLPQDVQVPEIAGSLRDRPRPNLKRSESESSDTVGRKFTTNKSPSTNSIAETKHEKSPSIPETNSESKPNKSRTRLPHNQVERKYRESLNSQLDSLRRVVPSLQQSRSPICDGADIEDLSAPTKPSKALVLASATAYIKQMEKEKRQLIDENAVLRSKVKALQSLVK